MKHVGKRELTTGDYATLSLLWCISYSFLLGSLTSGLQCSGGPIDSDTAGTWAPAVGWFTAAVIDVALASGTRERLQQIGFSAAALSAAGRLVANWIVLPGAMFAGTQSILSLVVILSFSLALFGALGTAGDCTVQASP